MITMVLPRIEHCAVAGLTISLALALLWLRGCLGHDRLDVRDKTILLTGASEGMGLSVARQLSKKGANIIIVARKRSKLIKALDQVKGAAIHTAQRFHFIEADVSIAHESERIVVEACSWNHGHPPDIVWCLAGSAHAAFFLETPRQVMQQQMDTNFWSCVDMAQAILPKWISAKNTSRGKQRHLVFTSSVVAFFPVAGYAPYAPSKAAIKSLSDTLTQELLLYGEDIKVHTVFPGTIQSPGLERENINKPEITFILEESDPVQTPDVVAAKAIAGLERGEYLVTMGWLGTAMRGCAWGGSRRNNFVIDTAITWITSIIWPLISNDLDGKVRKYCKKYGYLDDRTEK
ncbi:BgTH12-04336 [Blumeria graminis f. sp. triticale]|uniref:BgTH12-04336 n=1 Tax=Blumeria graminis f. sp. triticale TaxID=1689686 RepID=A0A9W4CZT8_BLUGR|nr:BgTH12-04336 [Blumeria graminis f. sp. triticale]